MFGVCACVYVCARIDMNVCVYARVYVYVRVCMCVRALNNEFNNV